MNLKRYLYIHLLVVLCQSYKRQTGLWLKYLYNRYKPNLKYHHINLHLIYKPWRSNCSVNDEKILTSTFYPYIHLSLYPPTAGLWSVFWYKYVRSILYWVNTHLSYQVHMYVYEAHANAPSWALTFILHQCITPLVCPRWYPWSYIYLTSTFKYSWETLHPPFMKWARGPYIHLSCQD